MKRIMCQIEAAVLATVLCMATIVAGAFQNAESKIEIAYSPEKGCLSDALFVKVTCAERCDAWPTAQAYSTDAGRRLPLELFELDRVASTRERWFVVVTPDKEGTGKIVITFGDDLACSVELEGDEEPAMTWARELFQNADGHMLMISLLERDRVPISASSRSKLLAITTSFPQSPHSRLASYIVGADMFLDLEREFSNNGPDDCYAACYEYFDDAIGGHERDPIYADALRRQAMAKAWSGRFDEAALHCKEMVSSSVSTTFADEGRKGLAELERYRAKREERLRQRMEGKSD